MWPFYSRDFLSNGNGINETELDQFQRKWVTSIIRCVDSKDPLTSSLTSFFPTASKSTRGTALSVSLLALWETVSSCVCLFKVSCTCTSLFDFSEPGIYCRCQPFSQHSSICIQTSIFWGLFYLCPGLSLVPFPHLQTCSLCGLHVSASLMAQQVKNPPVTQETQVLSLGRGDPLEKEMAT